MENDGATIAAGTPTAPLSAPIVEILQHPAPAADDKKATEVPAEGADDKKPETPEQQEVKKESRRERARQRARDEVVAAQTEARLLREQLAEARGQGRPAEAKTGEPVREDYSDLISFERAHTDWRTETRLGKDRETSARQTADAQAQEKVAKAWNEGEAKFKAATKDYLEVVTPFLDDELGRLSPAALTALAESDVGPALLYHVAGLAETKPDEFARIAGLSPARQVMELGRLETVAAAASAKRTTNAPEPVRPVNGNRSGSKDLAKMTQEEFEANMKANGSRWIR